MKNLIVIILILLMCGCKELEQCSQSLTEKEAVIAALRMEKEKLKAEKDYSSSTNDELRDEIAELKVNISEKYEEIKNLTLKNLQLEFENMIMQELIELITEKFPDIMDQITGD